MFPVTMEAMYVARVDVNNKRLFHCNDRKRREFFSRKILYTHIKYKTTKNADDISCLDLFCIWICIRAYIEIFHLYYCVCRYLRVCVLVSIFQSVDHETEFPPEVKVGREKFLLSEMKKMQCTISITYVFLDLPLLPDSFAEKWLQDRGSSRSNQREKGQFSFSISKKCFCFLPET